MLESNFKISSKLMQEIIGFITKAFLYSEKKVICHRKISHDNASCHMHADVQNLDIWQSAMSWESPFLITHSN